MACAEDPPNPDRKRAPGLRHDLRKFTLAMPFVPAAMNTRRMRRCPASRTMPSLRIVRDACHWPVLGTTTCP
jgi:hypothetical protein